MPPAVRITLDHIHTYARLNKKKGTYQCVDPHCYRVLPRVRLIGKASLCNQCHQEFTLTHRDLQLAKPKCLNCSDTKVAREFRRAKEVTESILDKLELIDKPPHPLTDAEFKDIFETKPADTHFIEPEGDEVI